MAKKYKIMLVAGEASVDAHAAKLARALRELAPDTKFEFFGATGKKMREADVQTVVKSDNLSIVGLPEIARALPVFLKVFQKLKQSAIEKKIDAAILIDFPDFNLKLAKTLKKHDIRIIYYISPQLWAWRKYRIKTIKSSVDLLLTILPFEKDWYRRRGFEKVEYVGNPLAREVKSNLTREEFCAKHNLDPAKFLITLLPGSRHKEIVRILPILLETACLMSEKNAEIQFVIALAEIRRASEVETAINNIKSKKLKLPKILMTVKNETYDALNAADAAAVTSGTATLETAIIGTPFVIVYNTSPFNWFALRPLISVEHYGLVNLIANKRLIKELIQNDFTPKNLSAELFRLLKSAENKKMRENLHHVAETLGYGGASVRAAKAILQNLETI